MNSSSKQLLILAVAMSLTACSNDKAAEKIGESASATASAPASSANAQYMIDVQAGDIEKAPEGTTLEPVAHDSDIYVPSDHPDAAVHLVFSLDKKGGFILVEGSGTLDVGGHSVPFEINQVSVMNKETLSNGQTLFFGSLWVDAKGSPQTFAFGFRFISETQELQLRLSNGDGLVVFGGGDSIAKNRAEIEQFEAALQR